MLIGTPPRCLLLAGALVLAQALAPAAASAAPAARPAHLSPRAGAVRTVAACGTDAALVAAVRATLAAGGGTVRLACAGVGPYRIPLTRTLVVDGGVALTLDGGPAMVAVDGGDRVQLFRVARGSLTLRSIVGQHGNGAYPPDPGASLCSGPPGTQRSSGAAWTRRRPISRRRRASGTEARPMWHRARRCG